MGSISNALSGLSILNQSGGLFANLPAKLSDAQLKAASPEDMVKLSSAALQLQQANGIFGNPGMAAGPSFSSGIPALDAADATKTTPAQQAAQAAFDLAQTKVQGLFYPVTTPASTFSLTG